MKHNLRSIFTNAIKSSYRNLDNGKAISFNPKSDRYTYENQEDTNYDKHWKPSTKVEKKTLSPTGYHRIGERNKVRKDIGIDDNNKDFYHEKQISIPSTCIKTIKYDPKTEGLKVKFAKGKKAYFYPAVPLELIQGLMKAPSKGEYFMKYIHDQYTMNPGHKRQGKRAERFYRKYQKKYQKTNKNKWGER